MNGKNYLALYLDAPMQSWGYQSRFDRRTTFGCPTRSGVFGMLCAAMGRDWSDVDVLNRLNVVDMKVFVLRSGGRFWDYHTVGGGYDKKTQPQFIVQKASGGPRGTVETDREYLASSRFGVVLAGPADIIDESAEAMKNPVWGVWFGRKACIPASIIFQGIFEGEQDAVLCLKRCAGLSSDANVKSVKNAISFDDGSDTLMDQPLDFKKREFAPRRIKME